MFIADFKKSFFHDKKYLKSNHIQLLMYIYTWVFSGKIKDIIIKDKKKYFRISYTYMAEKLGMNLRSLHNFMARLTGSNKDNISFFDTMFIRADGRYNNRVYVHIDYDMALSVLDDTKKFNKFLIENLIMYQREEMDELFEFEDKIRKPKPEIKGKRGFTKEAENFVRKILTNHPEIFTTRIPKGDISVSKTFCKACRYVQDIWNGTFGSVRNNPYNENLGKSKWFDTEDWRKTLRGVKGDYQKMEELMEKAISHYKLMFDERYVPFNKDVLPSSFEKWLFDDFTLGNDNPISYFILSFKEPNKTQNQLSEIKADKIFERIPEKAREGGNKLFEMNENMPSGTFWESIENMVEWGKLAFENEPNIQYWITSPSDIPALFAKYCEERGLSVSLSTVDIEKSVEHNSPWTWFVKDASLKHGLNSHLSECADSEDFYDCYKDGHYPIDIF